MRIDLNADLGESDEHGPVGDDAAMLALVTSANVATGFHAGDLHTMATTVALAAERGVSVGAHISYHDRDGFGRRFIDVEPSVLRAETIQQLEALAEICRTCGTSLKYVKPHGALYNTIATNANHAAAVVEGIADFDPGLPLLGLPDTVATTLAKGAGLRTVVEAFADRAYTATGALVFRGEPGAVLHDPDAVAARVLELVTTGSVAAIDGTPVAVMADSVCIHGDSPNAVAMARAVRAALEDAGVELRPFA